MDVSWLFFPGAASFARQYHSRLAPLGVLTGPVTLTNQGKETKGSGLEGVRERVEAKLNKLCCHDNPLTFLATLIGLTFDWVPVSFLDYRLIRFKTKIWFYQAS